MLRTLGITFVGLEAVDAFLTMWAVNNGFTELNPLLAPVAGTWVSPVVKILPAVFAVWFLTKAANRWPRIRPIANAGFAVTVAFLGAVIVSNLCEL